MKAFRFMAVILTLMGTGLAACGGPATVVPALPSSMPDPCAPENLKSTAGLVNSLMQRFDDESALASSVPRSQLAGRIAALQGIRRLAQEQSIPDCVGQLKQLQLAHMNTVIDTMLAFMSRGDQAAVRTGIETGRAQHDQYVMELAGLLGITPAAFTPPPTLAVEAPPEGTPAASGFTVLNPGPAPVTLRSVPATAADAVSTLPVGMSAVALGGSVDGEWIQVVVPDHPYQTAWVLASLVQITVPTPQP